MICNKLVKGPEQEIVRKIKEVRDKDEEVIKAVEEMKKVGVKTLRDEKWQRATKKLTEKFIGPYMVKKIVSENAVELELLASLRIHPVVNVRRIMKYREQIEEQKKIPPPPIEVASEKEYVVEEILDRQERRGKMKYLMK